MEKEIIVNGKKFKIRELLNSEARDLPRSEETDTPEVKKKIQDESIKTETLLCANITSEEYDKLTLKEYLTLRKAILDLNTPEKDFWVTN
jgi:hypothetical protein